MEQPTLNLSTILRPDGTIDEASQPILRQLLDQYPYYHAARMLLLRLLYQQHNPLFNEELRIAALYLPSRVKIYQEIQGDSLRPQPRDIVKHSGATHRRKSSSPVEHKMRPKADRTGELLDIFLNGESPVKFDVTSGRPVDASSDYMSWLSQQESQKEASSTSTGIDPSGSIARIDDYISQRADKRIELTDRTDDELQKPVNAENENSSQSGVFTEALARIYIKQGKFEQAIEIIRRLSLKYPKKNRYFADQIRFLEKIIINQQGVKPQSEDGKKE